MVMVESPVLRVIGKGNGDLLGFNIRVVDSESGIESLFIRSARVFNGHLSGPSVKLKDGKWLSTVSMGGDFADQVLNALEPWRMVYTGVVWPKRRT